MSNKCNGKSSCSTKRKASGTRGCPCKGNNMECSNECQCGTGKKPCKYRALVETSDRERGDRGRTQKRACSTGFRLSHKPVETEEEMREKEYRNVKEFIATLDEGMVRKLAIRSLRRGIGSMDYIDTLLIMEDDLDEDEDDNLAEFGPALTEQPDDGPPEPTESNDKQDWCVCSKCRQMPQAIENKCCILKKCITLTARFTKLCLDPNVLELCIRNRADRRNDQEDNSTRAFRKAACRQFILARYGRLGRGNRRVCPSCVVLKIRARFPSVTGIYMEH